jgi:hypothetical protein
MTTNREGFDFKSVCMVIVTSSILVLMFTVQPWEAYASNNGDCSGKRFFEKIGCGVDNAGQSLKDGERDGKRAGVNGEPSACPAVGNAAYCTGWYQGYGDGRDARNDLNKVQNSDDRRPVRRQ